MKMVLIITVAKTLKRFQPDKAPPIKSDPPGAGLVTTGGRKTLQGSLPIQGGIQGGPIPTDTGLKMLCNSLRHHNSGNIFRNHHQKEKECQEKSEKVSTGEPFYHFNAFESITGAEIC